MTFFNERERAFENRFAWEKEAEFMVNAKACSLFARWVAEEKLNLSKEAADRYCGKILALTVKDCNPQSLYRNIQKRLKKHKIEVSDRELEHQYFKALQTVRLNG
jgi:hypothetical protein